jgi:type IV secretory pathway VirB2 component (pilin)
LINHPDHAAIYPPGAQLVMAGLAKISPSVLFFKSMFALADLGVLYLLLRINTGFHRYRTTAWYAWSPAVVWAFAGAGHFDSLMLLAMVGAIWALYRSDPLDRQPPAWSWSIISAVLLGVSISIKVIPLFLVPVWLLMLRRRSAVLILTLLIPWSLAYVFGGPGVVLDSLRKFAESTRFNDLLWWVFEGVRGQAEWNNKLYTSVLGIVSIGLAVLFRRQWRRAMLWVLGAMLILSPVLHPWYVVWILPVACWRQCYPWFILALSSLSALLVWEAGPFWQPWQVTWPLRLMVVVPPLMGVAWWYWIRPRWVRPADSAKP